MRNTNVTTVVTAFNRPETVVKAVKSVAEQTARPRIVVVDDGQPCYPLIKDLLVSGDKYIHAGNIENPYLSWYQGLTSAETEFVTILHDDDWYEPRFIETLFELFTDKIGFAFSESTIKGLRDGDKLNIGIRVDSIDVGYLPSDVMENYFLNLACCITPSCVMLRTKDALNNLFVNTGARRPGKPICGPDKLFTMLTLLDYELTAYCSKPLVNLLAHPGSITLDAMQRDESRLLLKTGYDYANEFYKKMKELKCSL